MQIKKVNKKAQFRESPIGYEFFPVNSWIDKQGNVCYDTGVSVETEGSIALLVPPIGINRKQLVMNTEIAEDGNLVFTYKRISPYYKVDFEPAEFNDNDCIGRLVVLR